MATRHWRYWGATGLCTVVTLLGLHGVVWARGGEVAAGASAMALVASTGLGMVIPKAWAALAGQWQHARPPQVRFTWGAPETALGRPQRGRHASVDHQVREWLDASVFFDPAAVTSAADLYRSFSEWAAMAGHVGLKQAAFGRSLVMVTGKAGKTRRNGRVFYKGLRVARTTA